jgi:gamma-glutamylputrescine oxidase
MSSNLLYSNDRVAEYPDSWYAATAPVKPLRAKLQQHLKCDVCIVGAGFTGLSAALALAESGLDVVVLDAHRAGWGASGRNGGQLGSGQRLEQTELEHLYGRSDALELWRLAQRSKSLVKGLIDRFAIECDFRPGIVYADHKSRYSKHTSAYVEKLRQEYGYREIEFADRKATAEVLGTDVYHSSSIDLGAGHLHPLKYALGLAGAAESAGARLFEGTEVKRINYADPATVVTTDGSVTASFLVLACNGYLGDLNADVANRVMPINNFIIATAPMTKTDGKEIIRNDMAVADSRFVVNYYRKSADNRLLFGGRESYGYRFPLDIRSFVREAMVRIYPQLRHTRIDYGWGGTLAITLNRLPHVTSLSPNVFSASGYSGHGVGMATLSGKLIAEALLGEHDGFNVMRKIEHPQFPGGVKLRSPLLKLAMLYYTLRDRV